MEAEVKRRKQAEEEAAKRLEEHAMKLMSQAVENAGDS